MNQPSWSLVTALRVLRTEGVVRERLERGPPPRGHRLELPLLEICELVQKVGIEMVREDRGVSEPSVRGEGRVHHMVSPGLQGYQW